MANLLKLKIGIAPIGWTNDDMVDLGCENTFEQCVSEMALAGYKGCEIGNKYPSKIKELKKALKLRKLKIANCWFSSFILTKDMLEVEKEFRAKCKFLKAMGAKRIGVSEQSYSIQGQMDTPVFTSKYYLNDKEWKKFTEGLNYLGLIALEYGISLTYHHHMGTVVQDLNEIDKLMELTDSKYVSLLYDTGHLAYANIDYLAVLTKYISRIKHIHLKDIRQNMVDKVKNENLSFLKGVRIGAFTVPGDGDLDFNSVFKIIAESDYDGWLLVEAEQDPSIANPLEYAIKARKYILKLQKAYSK